MNKKNIISLIERNADEELKAYFASLTNEAPLNANEELALLERFVPATVKSYINRFRFSPVAEPVFIVKAPANIRLMYLNSYGLLKETQIYVIEQDLTDVLYDFSRMRRLANPDILLEKGSDNAVRTYLIFNPLENDDEVSKLLHRKNKTLFSLYANKWIISESIKREIVEEKNIDAFKTIVYRLYRLLRNKAKRAKDFSHLISETLVADSLPVELQTEVLTSYNREMIEILLKTTPLAPEAQEILWKHNFAPEWLKLHVEHIYCVGGYRFTPENEQKLFKILASKNLDDCLTKFRQQDDVSFVKFASSDAVRKYISTYWLSDDAQVALIGRGDAGLISALISRYTSEHGLCWQAEVELVKLGAYDCIRQYIAFHSLCYEALSLLKEKGSEGNKVVAEYYDNHPY